MTLDEAIKHADEVAEEEAKLCKRYDDASGYTRSLNEEIRTSYAKECEKRSAEHRQLAEWLKDYKRLLEREPCEDAISRDEMRKAVYECSHMLHPIDYLKRKCRDLPSVTPQQKTGHCKDCKRWKDSDGFYRRGGHAESQCPINHKEVYEGSGYC